MPDDTRRDRPPAEEDTTEASAVADTMMSPGTEETFHQEDQAVTPEDPTRYQSNQEIGRGGLGRVIGAFDLHLGREVAIKELLANAPGRQTGSTATGEALVRFLREARVTAQLEHPNIVPVYELGRRADGTLYYTMKVVRGRTLKEALKKAPELSDRLKLLGHFVDVCNAIAYAHSRGVIHRDLKPENVMIGEFGETVVLDWGVAKVQGKEDIRGRELIRNIELMQDDDASIKTMPGAAFGTPAYMSPEQAEGRIDDVDERSDVYCLGIMLYELLSGTRPFKGENVYQLLLAAIKGEYKPIREVCPEVPPELEAVVDHAMRPRPPARYQSAQELAEEIEAYRSGGQVEVYEYSSLELVKRFIERNRSAMAVSVVAMVALVVVLAGAWLRLLDERDRALEAEQQSKRSLADAFVQKGRTLALEKDWSGVELLAAAALTRAEHPGARGLLAAAEGTWRPELIWQQKTYAGCAAIVHNPAEDKLACGTSWGVQIWHGSTGQPMARLEKKGGWVHSLAYSPDGSRLAGGADGEILIWRNGMVEDRLRGHVGAVVALAHGAQLASGGDDGTVRLWGDGKPIWEKPGRIERLVMQDDLLVWSDDTGNVHRRTREAIRTLNAPHGGKLTALALFGKRVATAGPDELVRVHPGTSRALGGVTAIVLSEDRLYAAAGGAIVGFDEQGRFGKFTAHERPIRALATSPDGSRLFTASEDGFVRAFAVGGQVRPALEEAEEAVKSEGGLVARTDGSTVIRVDEAAGIEARLRAHDGQVTAIAFAKETLLSGGADKTVRVWPAKATEPSQVIRTLGKVEAVAGSPDVSLIAAADERGRVVVYEKTKIVLRIPGDGRVVSLAFDPAGAYLAVGATGRVRLFDMRDGREILSLETETRRVALDGEALLVTNQDGMRKTVSLARLESDRRLLLNRLEERSGSRVDGMSVTPKL